MASIQVEILFYRGFDRQRGRVFGSFAQVIAKTAIPFLRKVVVPAAKSVVDLELAVPEFAVCWRQRHGQQQNLKFNLI